MIFRWNTDVQPTGGEDEESDQRGCSSENLNCFWAFFFTQKHVFLVDMLIAQKREKCVSSGCLTRTTFRDKVFQIINMSVTFRPQMDLALILLFFPSAD